MARDTSTSVISWALRQVLVVVRLVWFVLLGGLFNALRNRTFDWLTTVAGFLLSVAGLGLILEGLEHIHQVNPGLVVPYALLGWFGLWILVSFLQGLKLSKIPVWESYLLLIAATALTYVELSSGVISGLGQSPKEPVLTWQTSLTPGQKLMGSLWDRLLLLSGLAGWVVAIFSGSIAMMLRTRSQGVQPNSTFEWFVTRRHVKGAKSFLSMTSIVAMMGVALGVGSLIAINGVMTGYQLDVQEKILETNAHLVIQKYGTDFTEFNEVMATLEDRSEILAMAPFAFSEAMIGRDGKGQGVLVKGVSPELGVRVTSVAEHLCGSYQDRRCQERGLGNLTEQLLSIDGVAKAVVGIELARELNLSVGDLVKVTTPVGIAGARGNAPKSMRFRVGGVFYSGMHEFDARLLYVELSSAQELFGLGEAVHGVELRVEAPDEVTSLATRTMESLGGFPYRTSDWRQLNHGIFSALAVQKVVTFLVLTFIVVVAAFNIASVLFMGVVERAEEVGILRAMGATTVQIMKIFVFEGWLVGGLGTLIGLVFGLSVAWFLEQMELSIAADVYMIDTMRVVVKWEELCIVVVAAVIISHLATIFPALRASRQSPVEALRDG